MKKVWQKHKKIIMGVMAIVLICSVVISQVLTSKSEAEASGILYDMNTKLAMYGNQFNILEIVPAHSEGGWNHQTQQNEPGDYTYEEMGVFAGNGGWSNDPGDAMKSRFFKRSFRGITNQWGGENTTLDRMLEMRMYGVLKYLGRDNGAAADMSDNPVYLQQNNSIIGAFQQVPAGAQMMEQVPDAYKFTRGRFTTPTSDSDVCNYTLEEGYYIGEDGYIYKIVGTTDGSGVGTIPQEPDEDGDDQNESEDTDNADDTNNQDDGESVSANSFTQTAKVGNIEEVTITDGFLEEEEKKQNNAPEDNGDETVTPAIDNTGYNYSMNYLPESVSGNTVSEKIESDLSAHYYIYGKKGENGNTKYCPLPEGVSYTPGDPNSNIMFVKMDGTGPYWGYDADPLAYPTNISFTNGDWFKTWVFGDRNIKFGGQDVNVNIDTKAADQVTVDDISKADLIYISGTYTGFFEKAKVDISKEVLEAIYNENVVNHKALIMDYDIMPEVIVDNTVSGNAINKVDSNSPNLLKLAIMLWQTDQKAASAGFAQLFDARKTLTDDSSQSTAADSEDAEENPDYGKILDLDGVLTSDALFSYLWDNRIVADQTKGNFVTGNLYVYDHHMDLFKESKCMVDCNDFFGNGDFNSEYTETIYNTAFSSVYAFIQNNNTSHSDYAVADGVTPALIVQYILCSDGSAGSLVKSNLSVLEIQPCTTFLYNDNNFESVEYTYASTNVKKNRDAFITKYINPDLVTSGKQGYISFTSMSINEFVCKNENILEMYDLVYIGSVSNDYYKADATTMSLDTWEKTTAQIPDFDDYKNMEGMVYYNIGDTLEGNAVRGKQLFTAGFLDGEAKDTEEAKESGKDTTNLRYAGRDLNTEKLEQLKSYLDAGHPVLVAEDLMCQNENKVKTVNPTEYTGTDKGTKWDHGRIDNSSKLYEFFMYALGYTYTVEGDKSYYKTSEDILPFSNFFSERDVTGPEELSFYLNMQQLYLELSNQPTEYEYTLKDNGVIDPDSVRYLQPDEDGSYYLDYEFTISNSTATTSNIKMSYTTKLFVDVNADGKFSSDEECDDAVITYALSGEEASKTEVTDAVDGTIKQVYDLEPGISYKIRRVVPKDYSGVITWCLRVENINDSRFQANRTGYTCIKAVNKPQIRILQINNYDRPSVGSWAKSYLNLEQEMTSTTSGFGKYLNNLADYEVVVDTVTILEFEIMYSKFKQDNPTATAMQFYDNYDGFTKSNVKGVNMLILGFGDDYAPFTDEASIEAVKAFIDSGRATLLCHDFLMFNYDNNKQVQTLRDVVGMDRYDVTGAISALKYGNGTTIYNRSATEDKNRIKAIESNPKKKAVAYLPGSTRNSLVTTTQGQSDYLTNWAFKSNPSVPGTKHLYVNASSVSSGKMSQFAMNVDQMNEGQITEYPYNIASSFKVGETHGQYYQLDMESDSDSDGSTDTTVWYTLSYKKTRGSKSGDEQYNATAGDGANLYYIYNKGNVTYTGSGHRTITDEEERILFVNTMLASYTAVDAAPTVEVYETASSVANTLKNIAIPYDSTITNPMDAFGDVIDGNGNNVKDSNGNNIKGTSVVDSSIQFNKQKNDYDYKFVDPNTDSTVADKDKTAVYFKATDANFKKGTKRMSMTFYMEVNAEDVLHTKKVALGNDAPEDAYKDPNGQGVQYLLDNNTWATVMTKVIDSKSVNVVEIPINVYDSSLTNTTPLVSKEATAADGSAINSEIQSGQIYAFYLPLYYLRYNSSVSIYIEAQTYIKNVATSGAVTAEINQTKGYTKLDITKVDLLKLD